MKKRSQTTNQQTFHLSKSPQQTTKKKYSQKDKTTNTKTNNLKT